MWNKSTKQRKSATRRNREEREAEERRLNFERMQRAQAAAIRNGQRRVRAQVAKQIVKFTEGR